ncbi:MAG: OmpW family protein [Rhodospirillales bacterium]
MKTSTTTMIAASVSAAVLAAAATARAYEPGDLVIQLMGQGLYADASGSVGQGTGWNYDSGPISANPALNISYFLTKNIAVQTVLAVPQLNVDLDTGDKTTAATEQWVLPLSIIPQYHFFSDAMVSPYVGAGLTYAMLWEKNSKLGGADVDVENTWGGLVNVGLNIKIPQTRWTVSIDAKKWWLNPTNVDLDGDRIGNLTVNPWFFGLGVGYTFSTPPVF